MMVFDLDSSKRHCWGPDNNGKYIIEGSFPAEICTDYKQHPKRAGNVEWMRFIHNFPQDGVFQHLPEGTLKLGNDFIAADGREVYCENYNDRVKIFLDHDHGIATIEIHDETLDWAALVALELVKQEYAND